MSGAGSTRIKLIPDLRALKPALSSLNEGLMFAKNLFQTFHLKV